MKYILMLFVVVNFIFAGSDINDTNISVEVNSSENNVTLDNLSEDNQTIIFLDFDDLNETNEEISDNVLDTNDEYRMDIAIILDKNKFFKFVPSLLNSVNAYLINKDINYNVKLFDKVELNTSLDKITQNYGYIFIFSTKPEELKELEKYPDNYFFIPTLNKRQISFKTGKNIFFGGIDYKTQINMLNKYINDFTIIVHDKSDLSNYITKVVDSTLLTPHKIRRYPMRYNPAVFDNTFVYLNTKVVNTAQILSNFTYYKINTKAVLSTQLNYTPFIFSFTNKNDVRDLIIANSILNVNSLIEDNNKNLDSDIDFNWLNFTTSSLLNVAYNLETDEDISFVNDFNLYMFFNQIQYKTELYKIFSNGFIKIEN